VTSACAAIFMLTSLTLAYHASHSSSVVRADSAAPVRAPPPAAPPQPAGTGATAPAPAPASPAPAAPAPAR
jgi:preprotein translocase subunit SecG